MATFNDDLNSTFDQLEENERYNFLEKLKQFTHTIYIHICN